MEPPKPRPGSFQHQLTRGIVALHSFWYRATGGAIGGWLGGPILLLTTRGRKTGARRTLPLLYLKTDRGYALVASYGGADKHPAWYLNLSAEPRVELQVGGRRFAGLAATVDAGRRAELWPQLVAIYAGYDTYQTRTEREIPIVEIVAADDVQAG